MPIIKVSGPLSSVKYQLRRIAALIRGRKNDGWTAFREDEVWEYYNDPASNVCPVCEGFGRDTPYSGDEIAWFFPDQYPADMSDAMRRHRYPNVHESVNLYPDLLGECHCDMFWRDPFMTLVNRLALEMVMVQ